MDFFYFFLGAILLFWGAEWLVKSSASLAFSWNVTPLVIGTVIVGYGTGLPELLVSAEATVRGHLGRNFGIPEAILGITIVALGTSTA